MKCKLCDKERELQNSHIIPEFAYKPLYDDKGRFHVVSTLKKRPRPFEQKGIRERLLCGECEQQLGIYEKYSSELIMGGEACVAQQNGNLIQFSDINYKKFKLFLLSILWRSSISSKVMFSHINLGPHENVIRELIRNEDPGKQMDYPCIIYGLKGKNNIQANFIDQPRKIHIDGHVAYKFNFLGFVWVYYVSSHKLPSIATKAVINEMGSMVISIEIFNESEEFSDFAVKAHKMGRIFKSNG